MTDVGGELEAEIQRLPTVTVRSSRAGTATGGAR